MRSYCEECGTYGEVHRHHIFPGPLRPISEEYGATVRLCPECHEGSHGIHRNRALAEKWKASAQKRIMREQDWTFAQWRLVFGKSYIYEWELEDEAEEPEGFFIAI